MEYILRLLPCVVLTCASFCHLQSFSTFPTLYEVHIVSFTFYCLDLCIFLSPSLVLLQVCLVYKMYFLLSIVLTCVSLSYFISLSLRLYSVHICIFYLFCHHLCMLLSSSQSFSKFEWGLHISCMFEMNATSTNFFGHLQTIFHTMYTVWESPQISSKQVHMIVNNFSLSLSLFFRLSYIAHFRQEPLKNLFHLVLVLQRRKVVIVLLNGRVKYNRIQHQKRQCGNVAELGAS